MQMHNIHINQEKGKNMDLKRYLIFFSSFLMSLSVNATTIGNLDINGYFSFEYEEQLSGDDEGDDYGSFDLDLIDIVLKYQLNDNVRVAADFTWEHGAATEEHQGNVAVEYAFVEYHFNDALQISAGKHFTKFGIYNEIHTAKPAYTSVKEPLATNKNNKLGSLHRFYPRWQTGLGLSGHLPIHFSETIHTEYVFQVSNGENHEENPHEEDNNHHKAFNGRINTEFEDFSLIVGLSFYNDFMESGGDYLDEDDASYVSRKAEIKSSGLHLNWDISSGSQIEFEYVRGTEDLEGYDQIERDAYSIMFIHHFNNGVSSYTRYETLDPNSDIDDDEGTVKIIGLNYKITPLVQLKFEVDEFDTGKNNIEGEANWTEFKAAFVAGF